MLQTEYVKNLHCNYEKVLLDKKPEERRYQYCILSRGGIKGLLSCSLRYLNGQAYLYYDITSKQNVAQLFLKKKITREWVKDFMWSFQQIRLELGRFLLEEHNILWYPEQIFQDLDQKVFSFLYMPYHEGENGFQEFLEFLVEHADYEDEVLVECIYKMYEQYEQNGELYLQGQILEDVKLLDQEREPDGVRICEKYGYEEARYGEKGYEDRGYEEKEYGDGGYGEKRYGDSGYGEKRYGDSGYEEKGYEDRGYREKRYRDREYGEKKYGKYGRIEQERYQTSGETEGKAENMPTDSGEAMRSEKRGLFSFLEGKRRRNREQREAYHHSIQLAMEGHMVAEEPSYEDQDYGRTVYIAAPKEKKEIIHRLYTPEGRIVSMLDNDCLIIGKKKGESDLVLEDQSVSRVHARIIREGEDYYLEDMNSTNGTAKNGLRLQPYERRKLEEEDEICLGTVELIFR
ncbi:MAG: FHA domain-containing protein [Candidatus Gastranaerophilales bacterium]|nr:FHA domain-containing protein [Candidatus Gastranaerophilales bacterium]